MMHTYREIVCPCRVCKANNDGQSLSAIVPASLLDTLGRSRSTIHGLVYSAHDHSFVGRVTRDALNISAA